MYISPYTCEQTQIVKERDDWADDDDPDATYYDVLCTLDGVAVEKFHGCLLFRNTLVSSDVRSSIVAQIRMMKEKQAKAVAKAAMPTAPKQITYGSFSIELYDLLSTNLKNIMTAKIRFSLSTGSSDDTAMCAKFNVQDERLFVDTFNQSLGVVLQRAYWYFAPAYQNTEKLLSIGEIKTRIDEARMALRRIPCAIAVATKQIATLEAKLSDATKEEKRQRYNAQIAEQQLEITKLHAEERQQTVDLADYEKQRADRSSGIARVKPAESQQFKTIMRAIRLLNTRDAKSDEFLADFMAYADTFRKQTDEEKFNEEITASGVSLNFRPMPAKPAKREVVVPVEVETPLVVEAPSMAEASPAVVSALPVAVETPAVAVETPARAPRTPRAPRQEQPAVARKGPSKSDRLAALMKK